MSVQPAGNPRLTLRRLTYALNQVRTRTKLTNADLAKLADTNAATLSRLLAGALPRPPVPVVERLARVFTDLDLLPAQASDLTVTGDVLIDLAYGAQKTGWRPWWHPYRDIISPARADYLTLEQDVIKIQTFNARMIPELLQTPAYVEAAIKAGRRNVPEETTAQWLQLRRHRQQLLLESSDPAHLWVLLDESVLHRQPLGPKEMADQFDRLLKLASYDHIKIAVIPYGAGLLRPPGEYSILTFSDPLDQDVVFTETHRGEELIDEPAEVDKIRNHFEQLLTMALPARKTISAIKAARDTLTA